MRNIDYIVVHCTATSQNATIDSIKLYWKNSLNWKNFGYHYIVDKDGNITQLTNDEDIANGVKGHNHNSLHVAYIGGLDLVGKPKDTRNFEQIKSLFKLLYQLKIKYKNAHILGHNNFIGVQKACPCFNAEIEYKEIDKMI